MIDYVYWIRGPKFAELAEVSIQSVHKLDRYARCYVYSDDEAIPQVKGAIVIRMNPGKPAMVANLEAQTRHILNADLGKKILFLDADVVLKKPFPFDTEASLYPTWRDHIGFDKKGKKIEGVAKLMPYNYGVLGARATRSAREAFVWMSHRVESMAEGHQNWYGNQFALAELCGKPDGRERLEVPIPRSLWDIEPRLAIRRLPCETWNYTPETAGEDVSGKGALHFKGGRKDLMEAYL
jgi:hypothetical protein